MTIFLATVLAGAASKITCRAFRVARGAIKEDCLTAEG